MVYSNTMTHDSVNGLLRWTRRATRRGPLRLLLCLGLVPILSGATLLASKDGDKDSIKAKKKARVLVLVYSRTDTTWTVARDIARRFNADLVRIRAPEYPVGVLGNQKASRDALDEKTSAKITPASVDLRPYKLVFIGGPIWWYRPAVPLWAVVQANRFQGKSVVLFNTFNSRFKQENIHKFRKLIEGRGGRWLDHIYVRRGRVYWQLSRKELLSRMRAQIKARSAGWLKSAGLK